MSYYVLGVALSPGNAVPRSLYSTYNSEGENRQLSNLNKKS